MTNPPTKPDIDELKEILCRLKFGSIVLSQRHYSHPDIVFTTQRLNTLITKKQLEELNFILDNASGGGSWRRVIIGRISELTKKGKA